MRFSNVNSVASPPAQVTINSSPPPAVGSSVGDFYVANSISPGDTVEGTLTTPNISGIDWMIISRRGVGGGGTIPLTVGYPTNADAAVQDVITITSSITGTQLFQNTINQQLFYAPGEHGNNGGQPGLFAVFPFIPNCEITLKTTWNTSLTDDLPMVSTSLFLVNKIYPYIPVLPSLGIPAISKLFTAGETMYMVYGSNMYPYDWITVNVNNQTNSGDLTVAIYAGQQNGYGLGQLLMPSTALGDGNNFFSVRMADSGLTSYIASPQIIVQVTSLVAQSVFVLGYAYPDLSKPLLYT